MTILSSKALKRIIKELTSLQQSPPEDIQVIANEENLTEIQAWIRGPHGTPYEEGYFRVKLVLDESFPDTPPKGYFITKIFHPNVSPIGEICVNTLQKDWKPELGIEHVLLTIKCLLIVPNPESALNEEAGKLLLEQYDDYAKRARLYTSIQAKWGKSEFMSLFKERSHNDEENKKVVSTTTLEEKSNTASSSSDTSAAQLQSSTTVLKPLSNTSPIITTPNLKKRTFDSTMDQEQQQQQQGGQDDLMTAKKVKKNNGKKKSLRRL